MGPEALAQVLRPLADLFDAGDYPDLLRGLGAPDDALVWRLNEDTALALTADFFPPIVDDPYHFGAIAAANSLSDLYAMGATPMFGINLVGFPEGMDPAILSEILRGGGDKVKEAGAVVGGGHTTSDKEPKYGLAVVGRVRPDRMLTNGGARPGDVLLLTKRLGTGILTTAHRKGKSSDEHLEIAIATMSRLSGTALSCLTSVDGAVHSLTDITGFSLAGHAHEIAHQSGVMLRIEWDAVPILPGVERHARKGHLTGGAGRNRSFYGRWITFERAIETWQDEVLFDPQTSGGLLAAVAPEHLEGILRAFERAEEPVARIGEVTEGDPGTLVID
jgi:selenide,water dikinase